MTKVDLGGLRSGKRVWSDPVEPQNLKGAGSSGNGGGGGTGGGLGWDNMRWDKLW